MFWSTFKFRLRLILHFLVYDVTFHLWLCREIRSWWRQGLSKEFLSHVERLLPSFWRLRTCDDSSNWQMANYSDIDLYISLPALTMKDTYCLPSKVTTVLQVRWCTSKKSSEAVFALVILKNFCNSRKNKLVIQPEMKIPCIDKRDIYLYLILSRMLIEKRAGATGTEPCLSSCRHIGTKLTSNVILLSTLFVYVHGIDIPDSHQRENFLA